ncbi:MAG: hypothetical protein ACR2Q4_03385, partial [Geminicoccaceae bacterium]
MATSSKPGQAISRRYSLIAAASVIPLFVVVLLLAWFQFQSQRDQLIEELEGEVAKHGTLFSNVIGTVRDHIQSLAAWADIYQLDPGLSAEQALSPTAPNRDHVGENRPDLHSRWRPEDSQLFSRGEENALLSEAELGMAEGLVQHMRLAHQAMPYLRWSYYFADSQRFVTLYPKMQNEALGGTLRTMPDEQVVETMFAQPIIARSETEPAATPSESRPRPNIFRRASYWTQAFLDPAGAGWVVAHASEVPTGDGSSAVVATALLLDFLTGFIRAFDYPCGKVWLVNDQRQILAASDGRRATADGLRLLTLDDVLPEALRRLDTPTLTGASSRFKTFDDVSVLSRPITATPWHLL